MAEILSSTTMALRLRNRECSHRMHPIVRSQNSWRGHETEPGGTDIHPGTLTEGVEPPTHVWVPSIAPSGLMIYTGDKFPAWRGNVFVGGLAGQQLARLTLEGTRVTGEETLLRGRGRVRDIKQGPDGFIYIALENQRGGLTPIVRLEPAAR